MALRRDIAIIGAGMGGLAAGALLAADGHRVQIFDQFAAPRPLGSGLVLQPTGQAVLAHIGALADAQATGAPLRRMLGHEVGGRCVLDVLYDRRGQRSGLAIHRASLFDALLAAARRADVPIVPDSRAIALGDGPRRYVHMADGRREGPFDLVVDAAGARSPLSAIKARPLRYGALWGSVDWVDQPGMPPDQLTQRYRRASHMLGIMPMGRRPGSSAPAAAIFYSLPVDQYENWQAAGLSTWQAQAAALWPAFAPYAAQITDPGQLTMARYAHGTLARPVAEGLVHIGDAAHQASPQLGQGANMALLDALALARALRLADLPGALADYTAMRRWHIRLYQVLSFAFTPQYQSASRSLPMLRDHIFAPATRIPPLPRILSRLVCGDLIPPLAGGSGV